MGEVENIVAFNTATSGGGAEKVAYTICKELHLRGYKSSMYARRIDYQADPLVRKLVRPMPGGDRLYSAGNFLDDFFSTQYLFYLPTWRLLWEKDVAQADVLHFHNLHGYYFNLLTAPFLMRKKPVVWTFHDMWPFTGKCSHAYDCDGYMASCGECPQLSSYPRLRRDTTKFHLSLKQRLFRGVDFTIISPSQWLKTKIEHSILSSKRVVVIPSPVDTSVFQPLDKSTVRNELAIPQGKLVLMFIASWVNSIPSKGLVAFKEMVAELNRERDDLYAIIVGHLEGKSVLAGLIPGVETGWIGDAATLRKWYAAADLFVSPTLAENSSCTIVESMACGTPVLAFATGGVPEQVRDGITGLLVPTGDMRGLISAVRAIVGEPEKLQSLGVQGAAYAAAEYSLDRFIERHLSVYESSLSEK